MSSQSICIKSSSWLLLAILVLFSQWAAADTVETAMMPGKVIEGHAKYEQECEKCHKRFDKAAQTRLCLDCHKETAADIRDHKKFHGSLKDHECRTCHTDHKGRNAKVSEFDKTKFKHEDTGFILKDKHGSAKCEKCHKPNQKYREAPTKCDGCHRKDDVHKGKAGAECGDCHNSKSWKEYKFDHEKTKFSLVGGKHADVACNKCHVDKTFKGASMECVACHRKDDKVKGHKGRFGTKCETCHTDRGWKVLRFDHDKETKYPLRGKHEKAKCDACHLPSKGALYSKQKLPTNCVACHRKDDKEKGHAGGLGEKCDSCHNEKGWKETVFNHDKDTKYPLKGKHREAKCDTCHKGGVAGPKAKLKVEKACVACHRKNDQEKGHKGKYGEKCESCHSEDGWKSLIFDHKWDTRYPLRFKHKEVPCKKCHVPEKPLYGQKLDTACLACHRKDDAHKGQLGAKCENCHQETKWKDAPFDHSKARFVLSGVHTKVECKKCHQTAAYHDAPSACVKCHQKDDAHKKQLGPKCEDCHNSRSWKSWDYNHEKRAKFKIDGAHAKLGCLDCHTKPVENTFAISRACSSCHAEDDVHDGAFGQVCERCHLTTEFSKLKEGVTGFTR
ncbi:MAG TPA: cytochrome C [Gallionella sp.]|nr:cytochrome C [Gallionella sp.]